MATLQGHSRSAPHKKKAPRLAQRRKGEEAKGRPSHEERWIFGLSIRVVNDSLQNVGGHLKNNHINRKAITVIITNLVQI